MQSKGEGQEETFILRATPSIKTYNIARFDLPQLPKLKTCSQPVMMYREPEKIIEDDEEKKEEEVGYNPALRKRRRRRRKDSRTAGWVIEDKDGKNKFNGTVEGGQSSTYMLLIKNQHNNEFSVIPVEQWFRFKKPLNYRTLTLEEAEELNNEKKRAVERWLMKHKLAGEEKSDGRDVVSAPKIRTGAVGGGGGAKTVKKVADDMFSISENKTRRAPRTKKGKEGDPTGEDGGDFDEKFDDDESDAEIMHDEQIGAASDSDEDEFEVDAEAGKLTETGQAMKDLLKRAQSGEMDANNEKSDDDEASSEDEYSAKDMDKIRRDLGGNIIKRVETATAMGTSEEAKSAATDGTSTGDGGATQEAGAKRKADQAPSGTEEPRAKQPKPSTTSSSSNKLTEALVQQELIRYGGRMRTKDLLKKLKRLVVTDDDKALLKDIVRTICNVEVDAIDGKMLVLKSQFR